MKPATPKSRSNRSLLLLPILALVGLAAWFAWSKIAAGMAASDARRQLFASVDEELAKEPVDTSALSRLVAQIDKLEDHATAQDALFAKARIEMARGRPERAYDLFAGTALRGDASDAERRLLATILVRRHQAGSADRSQAIGWLRDGLGILQPLAERTDSVEDWFAVWQAATRLADDGLAARAHARLQELDRESRQARLTAAAASFLPENPADHLFAMRAEFGDAPVELEAMAVLAQVQAGENAAAAQAAEAMLARAPGVLGARWCAAMVFHVCALASPDEVQKASWQQRRNVQLDWLQQQAEPDDRRRETWASMRSK